jgi:hypothetical protein
MTVRCSIDEDSLKLARFFYTLFRIFHMSPKIDPLAERRTIMKLDDHRESSTIP